MTSAAVPERAGRTDTAARVAKLFERHGRMVYGVCRAMLRDTHEAEDATQQTFLSAHCALLGGARVRDEGAWLATIARNECRARITAGMRRPLSLGDDDLALIADPADETQRRSQAEALRSALADLPERQREAVVLRDIYGLRYGEVAKAIGLSRPATEALLFRARRAMRQRLRPVVTTALVVPLSVQEGLAQALPGFATAGSGAAIAGAAGGGLLAKLTAGPAAAKFATAAVAVTTVGAVGTVESERAGRDRAERPALAATASSHADGDEDSSGHGRSSREEDRGDDGGGGSGPGSRKDDEAGGDNSGSDSRDVEAEEPGADGSSDRGGADDDAASTGRGSEAEDASSDDSSGRGSGSDDDATRTAEEAGEEPPSSSGHGSSGEPADDADEPDSSGKGSGDDDSSGKGSGGDDAGDDESEDD